MQAHRTIFFIIASYEGLTRVGAEDFWREVNRRCVLQLTQDHATNVRKMERTIVSMC